MRVLHITNNFPSTKFPIFGIFVKEQIDSLQKLGVSNDILFINGRENGKSQYVKGIFTIRNKINKNKYDLIHCHHSLTALMLIISGKCFKNKILVSFQNDPVYENGKLLFKIIKLFVDGIVFKNNSFLITDDKSFYLPNGVNTNFFKPGSKLIAKKKLGLDEKKIYILFVSSNYIRKQKRYDIFTKTLEILKNKYGYKNIEEVKLINCDRSEIPNYFNAVDLHLLTSDFEGSPNSVKESMACNTPVVSTNVGNVFELLKPVNNSFVSKENSAEELASLVNKVLKNNRKSNGSKVILDLGLNMQAVGIKLKNIYVKLILK